MITVYYELYTNDKNSTPLGVVSVSGEDEDDCRQQIDAYLETKQRVYGLPVDDDFSVVDEDEL